MPSLILPRRSSARLLTVAVASLLAATAADAQLVPDETGGGDEKSAAAYAALTLTPVAGLAPTADFLLARPGAGPRPLRVSARYAGIERAPFVDQRAFAASVELPVGRTTLELTAGYARFQCDNEVIAAAAELRCRGAMMLGARIGAPLRSWSLDAAGTSALIVGADVSAGFADGSILEFRSDFGDFDVDAQAFAASVALPLALPVRSGNMTVAPILSPRLGFGHLKATIFDASDSRSGMRAQLGAGVAVRFSGGLGIDIGLQRVFIEDGETTYGAGVSFGF